MTSLSSVAVSALLKQAGYATAVAGKWTQLRYFDTKEDGQRWGFDEFMIWGIPDNDLAGVTTSLRVLGSYPRGAGGWAILRRAWRDGDRVTLRTARGERQFPVSGVFYDYGSDLGIISISQFTVAVYALAQFAFAYSLIAQLGIYIHKGHGQLVRSLGQLMGIQ